MKAKYKDIKSEILKSKSRFLSILIIALLGTLTYVGLHALTIDINKTVNKVVADNNMYDIRIEAPAGFTNDDIALLRQLRNVKDVKVIRENVDFDSSTLYIESDKVKNEGDAYYLINNKYSRLDPKYNVIGPNYDISYMENNINKFGKKIKKAFLVSKIEGDKNVALIWIKNLNKDTFSKEYVEEVDKVKTDLKRIFANRPFERKIEIEENLNDGIKKIDEGLDEVSENKKTLEKNEKLLLVNEQKLREEKKKFLTADKEFEINKEKIKSAKIEVEENKKMLLQNQKTVLDALKQINDNLPSIKEGLKVIKAKEQELLSNENRLENSILSESKKEEYRVKIREGKKKLSEEKDKLNKVLDNKNKLEQNKLQIEDGLDKIREAEKEIYQNEQLLNNKINEYHNNYSKNLKKIKDSEIKIKESKQEILDGFDKISKAKDDLLDKKINLTDVKERLEAPIYIVGTRFDNDSFKTIYNNLESTEIMCIIFPLFFFIVVLFVVTTTMIRFSIEQKNIIGTYRFLGYTKAIILAKFLIYSLVPTVIGIVVGSLLGVYYLPRVIYPAFITEIIPIFSKLEISVNYKHILIVSIILIITISIAIIMVINKTLKDKIINLITGREENIKENKILLEKVPFIWNKLNFSQKILCRNIFKYKSRLIMTLVGLSTCTALIYLAVSLNFSIRDITKYQYQNVQKFDYTVYFESGLKDSIKEEYIDKIKNDFDIYKINSSAVEIRKDNLAYNINLIYLINGEDDKYFNFNLKDKESAISLKTYKILNTNNKNIEVFDVYNKKLPITITKVFENYIHQYIYIKDSKKSYNALILKAKNPNVKDEILFDKNVYNVISKNDTKDMFEKQVKSITMVIFLMISLGAILAAVVTYNLGNINIIERKRELSTLKVLGYRFNEMVLYIFREIIILSLISIIIGLFFGRGLQLFLSNQFTSSPIQLVIKLNYRPFLISFILSVFFVLAVLLILTKKIRKINMMEALKSNE